MLSQTTKQPMESRESYITQASKSSSNSAFILMKISSVLIKSLGSYRIERKRMSPSDRVYLSLLFYLAAGFELKTSPRLDCAD